MTEGLLPVNEYEQESPYVLVTVLAKHPDAYGVSERLRGALPADGPPEGWLWCYIRPVRPDRFQVAVLMQRRPDGSRSVLDRLAGLGCGEITWQEFPLGEEVLPPRTPLLTRASGRAFRRRGAN